MATNRSKLEADWVADPRLRILAFDNVEQLAEHLTRLHKSMMDGGGESLGYLYQQQTLRLRQALKELEDAKRRS